MVHLSLIENGYRLRLKGGEPRLEREQAIRTGILHVIEGGFPKKVRADSMLWYKKEQVKAKTCRYILVATDLEGTSWVATTTVLKGSTEMRSFGPLDVPCTQERVLTGSVPTSVQEVILNLIHPVKGSHSYRLRLLRL